MHGIMFVELSRYVDKHLGPGGWDRLARTAGLGDRVYEPGVASPDEEFVRLVALTADATGHRLQETLEDFGRFVAPDLLGGLYGLLIDPSWDLMDFLEHTEETIHTVVRARDPVASPPRLIAKRRGFDEVMIVYSSPRNLCSVAKGIIEGAAKHYRETIVIDELACMRRGDPRCQLVVKRAAAT
jgi:predicted hydrocarbon binding protein